MENRPSSQLQNRYRGNAVNDARNGSTSSFVDLLSIQPVAGAGQDNVDCAKSNDYFNEKRHDFMRKSIRNEPRTINWRITERMKTVSVALVICLNIGVDPPDKIVMTPCSRLQCWIDPMSTSSQKAMELIGKNLQSQYEFWQPRARYKQLLDPTAEELKKLSCALRRSAKDDRVLFHYNGHGVPKPTASGELWVFNKNFTQYIPVSIYDIMSWTGAPVIHVFDCSCAGNLVDSYLKFAQQRDSEAATTEPKRDKFSDAILFGACAASEVLDYNPDFPADLFTSCLTTPIEIALRWFVLQNRFCSIDLSLVSKIPGKLNDRRTPLGELNWIFTAVTDTIAWNMLDLPTFKKLFRQDLMVAALFRNFLLAQRLMFHQRKTPISYPKIPETHDHALWSSWDLAVDMCLNQLPGLLQDPPVPYIPNSFFAEQLTAFEIALELPNLKKAPEQLPIVLQVLLSQAHRLRALVLLGRFLDLGSWAVQQALAVGIFPYILKLLQSPAPELKLILVFIWARIIAVDSSCQNDLLKECGYQYFADLLFPSQKLANVVQDAANLSELRAMGAFVLACFCHGFVNGQTECLRNNVITGCLNHMNDSDPLLRQWCCICIGKIIENNLDGKWLLIRDNIYERIFPLVSDPVPEVRAAAINTLSFLFGGLERSDSVVEMEENVLLALIKCSGDANPLVRYLFVIAIGRLVLTDVQPFIISLLSYVESEKKSSVLGSNITYQDCVIRVLLNLSMDSIEMVRRSAALSLDYVVSCCLSMTHGEGISFMEKYLGFKLPRKNIEPNNFENMLREDVSDGFSYFEWCSQFFKEPRLKTAEDASAPKFDWYTRRNKDYQEKSASLKTARPDFQFKASFETTSDYQEVIRFHPFENYLIYADERSWISLYDYQNNVRMNSFKCANLKGSRITDIKLINEKQKALLAAGTDEGFIRIYTNFEEGSKPELVTSWRALGELVPDTAGIGIVLDWYHQYGLMIAAGDVKYIRVWDAESETCISSINCKTQSGVTCLTGDKVSANTIIGGCADGVVRVFDRRLDPGDSCTVTFKHSSYIVGASVNCLSSNILTTSS